MASRELKLLPLALLVMTSFGVQADELDTVQFKAGQSVQYDSNVFRLPDSADSRSDIIGVTTVGAKIDKPYGLQRFEFGINADRYNYKNNSNLAFTAVNYAAAWRWSLTPALHGNLTTDRREFVDNTEYVANAEQLNRRTDRSTVFDAEYEIDGPWRIVGGVFERNSSNSQPLTFEGDSRVRGVEGGVRYVFSSGTSLDYRLKHGSGDYPDRVSSSDFASNFKDREHEFRLDWPITGKTTIQSRMSYFDRAHEGLSTRDFSGVRGQVNATWVATGKTKVTGGVVRELGSYQTADTSYYQGHRIFIAPTWKPTEKTAFRLRYDHGVRDYKGFGSTPTNRRDTTDQGSVTFDWQPVRAVTLTLSLLRDQRKSNTPGFDYKSNGVLLSALASF